MGEGSLEQGAADPEAPQKGDDRHVLHLDLTVTPGRYELQVPDKGATVARDENVTLVDVVVELARGVLGVLEERPNPGPVPPVPGDVSRGRGRWRLRAVGVLAGILFERIGGRDRRPTARRPPRGRPGRGTRRRRSHASRGAGPGRE